ncbi:phage portal protein [Parasphingopyxis marina]|uniref:Phage portal protein n=1 Tax=Parasphingopyxis marina TaxID=2761622 RepID=A0A842I335_9SPHN|nr:phage portal protein [Parasphingopyxis marina]MBC2778324.1 phage portal protein [Parasphingopyxis marina]
MKLFGRKSGGASARPALLRAPWGALTLGDWPRGYEAQVRAAYCENAVAQRAVRLVGESAGGAPLDGGAREVALASATSAGQSLVETAAIHLLLHGNAFLRLLCDADGEPAELYALRPERVTVEPDAQGWPAAFLYRVGESVERLAAKDGLGRPGLVHIRAMHPLDDHYGLGALGAAAGAVAIHNAATRWNKALLDNAARPSGALVYDPGDPGAALSPEQFARLKEEMEAGFQGAANAGRPMLLEGGLKWQAMSLSPADMDFVGLKAAAAREIALAFGAPPMLLGLPGDNTYANYREANRALWRLGVLPLMTKILSGIAQGLSAWWPEARLAVDLDRVPALSEDRERLWKQVSAADFLSPEEKRQMLGIAP